MPEDRKAEIIVDEKIREAAQELQKRENISFGEAWERIVMVLESYGVKILSS